ncbi:hypothetical protein LMTR3_13405 [Bradyrhizobium sp. LMTR 3]|nr:hypothetical protein LMTR3_13405 [Bradyrhizobium sp. LMTR 3]
MAPGISDRLVRIHEIGPGRFLVACFEHIVFGPARPIHRYQHVLDVSQIDLREPADVVGRTFGVGKILIELRAIDPLGDTVFAEGLVNQRHQITQAEQGDRPQPADPGLIAVFCRPFLMEPDKKSLQPIALDAALPCQEGRCTKQCFTDESVDRAVGDQG